MPCAAVAVKVQGPFVFRLGGVICQFAKEEECRLDKVRGMVRGQDL